MPIQGSSPRSAAADDRIRAAAKWGAACSSCAAAKAKCIRTNEEPGSKCDRCQRLLKTCTGQVHRPRKKRANKPSKTAELEERLNGLVDLLRATGELPTDSRQETASPYNPPSVPSLTRDATSGPSSGPSPQDARDNRLEASAAAAAATAGPGAPIASNGASASTYSKPPTIPATYNSFAPPSCICRPESGETVTDFVESDEVLLDKFRTEMHPLLPLVVLPTYDGQPVTAARLAIERPFLFLAIRTVASVDNYRSMQGLMYQLINHVADYMLLRAERSMDLMQGLLTILSWYHHHCMMHSQLGNLLHLATSLVTDLNLTRPPRIAERTDLMVLHPNPPMPRTNEERRGLLGIWYIRSTVAICFQKTEPMRYSPYIHQCVQELEEANEVESDATLVALIRIQHLTEKIAAFNSRDETCDEISNYPRAPRTAYKIAFKNELDVLLASLPEKLKKHILIESHVSNIFLRIHEPPLLDVALLQKLSTSLTSATSPMMATVLDTLYSARNAIQDFFDRFFTIPVHMFPWLPLSLYSHLIHSITMLSRWARLIGPVRPPQQPNARGPMPQQATSRGGGRKTGPGSTMPSTPAADASGPRSSSGTPSAAAATPDTCAAPLGLKDPSHRLVPGQGATASAPGASVISLIPGVDSRDLQRDPTLLANIARLREHLRQQPELVLDITGMLASIWERFEQSNRDMRARGAAKFGDSVGRGMNAWDLTARKIAIMRFKVGRYLDGTGAMGDGCAAGDVREQNEASLAQAQARRDQTERQQQQQHQQQQQQQNQYQNQGQQSEPQQQNVPYNSQTLQQPVAAYAQQLPYGDGKYAQEEYQPHQQLPLHSVNFSAASPGLATPMPPPLQGLPPDLGNYVMSGVGVGAADLSYGLGNLEGWESDPLWGAELYGPGNDSSMWVENMDWASTQR